MIKILFIAHETTRTGAPIALLQLLKEFRQHYEDIGFELLYLRGGELLPAFEQLCPLHKGLNDYTIWNRIKKRILRGKTGRPYLSMFSKGQFDVIYANTVVSFNVALELKRKLGIPVVGHVHESEAFMHSFSISKDDLKGIDAFISVSRLTSSCLINNYGVPSDKISIQYPISAWVMDSLKNKDVVNEESFGNGHFLIGLFCNGSWYKSTELIPVIMSAFYSKYPTANCRFVVIGRIPQEAVYHLRFDLRKLQLEDRIMFFGESDNPLSIVKRLNVLLLPSREESYSLVAQEAAFMRTPIVGFKGATGAAEWISDKCGILVSYFDFPAMADAIYSIYSDEAQRTRLGDQGCQVVEEMYKSNSEMDNVVHVLQNVTEKQILLKQH